MAELGFHMNNQAHIETPFDSLTITHLFYFVALIAAIGIGAVISTGKLIPLVMVLGAVVSLFLMFQPLILLWVVTFITLIIAGGVSYEFPALSKLWWSGYILGFILYIPALLHVLSPKGSSGKRYHSSRLGFPVLIFVGICVLSTAVNSAPLWQAFLAVKSIFLYGGVWAALAAVDFSPLRIKQWLVALFGIGLIQAVPVLYQYLFVRSHRLIALGDLDAADSVVGTFGGSTEGGGLGAVLALYSAILVMALLMLRKFQLINRFTQLWMLVLLVPALLLTEVKVIFVYFPVALGVLYWDVLKTKPLAFIGGGLMVVTLGIVLLVGYQIFHWSAGGSGSITQNIIQQFSYSFDEKFKHGKDDVGRMTRREVLGFWWDKHGTDDLIPFLIGHGLGASKTGGLETGYIAKKYAPLQIDLSCASSFLWDVGLLGVSAYLMLLYLAFLRAGKLARSTRLEPWQRVFAAAIQPLFALLVINIAYDKTVPFAAPMMFMLMASIGMIEWLFRQEQRLGNELRV